MKKIYTTLLLLLMPMLMMAQAQGWPANYDGVMLQAFSWDNYSDSQWTKLERQADDFKDYIDLVWIPQSADCGGQSMGYNPLYWFPGHYNSSFGTETELRTMISTFKQKGIGTIADIVINHRGNVSNWVDFPAETYNGITYQLTSTDICRNDDGGAALTWANANGYSLSANNDTGEDFGGYRDLDHQSDNVKKNVKAYLSMLLNDMGYIGFRYDVAKGFKAEFFGEYNYDAKPTYSVGEYWDGSNKIKNWIDGTNKQSAAFDFQFRYTVRNAINNNDWTYLGKQNDGNYPLVSSSFNGGEYRQYAVTFVENHDMQDRGNVTNYNKDPIVRDTLAANAYLLAMPGTPCIFMPHWKAYKEELKAMISVRKAAGIKNTSTYSNMRSNANYYANLIKNGTTNALQVVVGKDLNTYVPSGYTKVLSGYHYAYYLPNAMETAWADKADGEFEDALKVTLSAVSETSGAQLVYTLDGTTPTASSTKANSGTVITITDDCTLTVGLLVNGVVKGIVKRIYTKTVPEETKDVTVYMQDAGWSKVYFYAWDNDGQLLGGWPGTQMTAKKTIGGKQWYYYTFKRPVASPKFNIIFNKGDGGSNQTVDIENITEDKYYTVNASVGGNKMTVNDVTSQYTAINDIRTDGVNGSSRVYTLDGRMVSRQGLDGLPKGIYIVNGKKVLKK
jgi:alpha-amylase